MRIVGVVTWLGAAALLVPIVVRSVAFLARWRPPPRTAPLFGRPVWPPTFSTGVFAIGALAIGHAAHLGIMTGAGRAAAVATLVLWTGTAVLRASGALAAASGRVKRSIPARHRSP